MASSDGFELIEAEDAPRDALPAVETDDPEPGDAQVEALLDQCMRRVEPVSAQIEAMHEAEGKVSQNTVEPEAESQIDAAPTAPSGSKTYRNKNTTKHEATLNETEAGAPKSAGLKPSLQVRLPQQAEAVVQKLPTKAQDYLRSVYGTFTVPTHSATAHVRLEIAALVILQLWAVSHSPCCAIIAAILVVFAGPSLAVQARLDGIRSKVRPLLRAVPLVGLVPGAFGVILAFSGIPYLISAVLGWITDYLVWTVLAAYTGAEVGCLLLSKETSRSM